MARMRAAIGEPPADLDERGPARHPTGPLDRPRRARCAARTAASRRLDDVVPDDFPLGYHDLVTDAGTEPAAHRLPRPLLAARAAGLGLVGAAVRRPVGRQRRDRRPRRPAHAARLDRVASAAASCWSTRCTPPRPGCRRRPAPTCPRPAASATRSTCALDEVPGVGPRRRRHPSRRRVVDRDAAWTYKRAALRRAFDAAGGRARATRLRRLASRAGRGRSRSTPPGRRSPRSTAPTGTPGRRRCTTRTVPTYAASRPSAPTTCRSTPGCSGSSPSSCARRPGRSPSSRTCPSASPAAARTPGPGRACSPTASPSAPRPTRSTASARTGARPPLTPWRLREADYEPFIESVRATIAGAGGIRIDHVMGLFRLWWIPRGRGRDGRLLRALPGRGPARHRVPGVAPRRGPSWSARTSASSRTASWRRSPSAAS